MADYELAQLNIAKMRMPMESPGMAGFTSNLDRINALAESSPGFVWRLKDDSGNASALRPFGDDLLVNLSVWKDVESLQKFVFKTAHADIMKRRLEWFDEREALVHRHADRVDVGSAVDLRQRSGDLLR